jgi:hypothetical protein
MKIVFARRQNLAPWDWNTGSADSSSTVQREEVYRDIVKGVVLEHDHETYRGVFLIVHSSSSFFVLGTGTMNPLFLCEIWYGLVHALAIGGFSFLFQEDGSRHRLLVFSGPLSTSRSY